LVDTAARWPPEPEKSPGFAGSSPPASVLPAALIMLGSTPGARVRLDRRPELRAENASSGQAFPSMVNRMFFSG